MQRKSFIKLAVGAITMAIASLAAAQAYPSKPVKVVIPFPPGGTLDTVGRQLAQKLSEQMGQPFIIENRPGGNGVIGGDVVAKAGQSALTRASCASRAARIRSKSSPA